MRAPGSTVSSTAAHPPFSATEKTNFAAAAAEGVSASPSGRTLPRGKAPIMAATSAHEVSDAGPPTAETEGARFFRPPRAERSVTPIKKMQNFWRERIEQEQKKRLEHERWYGGGRCVMRHLGGTNHHAAADFSPFLICLSS